MPPQTAPPAVPSVPYASSSSYASSSYSAASLLQLGASLQELERQFGIRATFTTTTHEHDIAPLGQTVTSFLEDRAGHLWREHFTNMLPEQRMTNSLGAVETKTILSTPPPVDEDLLLGDDVDVEDPVAGLGPTTPVLEQSFSHGRAGYVFFGQKIQYRGAGREGNNNYVLGQQERGWVTYLQQVA